MGCGCGSGGGCCGDAIPPKAECTIGHIPICDGGK